MTPAALDQSPLTPTASLETAGALLELFAREGVDYVFVNPGTDTFPLQEAWCRRREQGLASPAPVLCLHEHVAVSAAHGFFLASGRPQVALLHVDAGTVNAGGSLHNAQRAQAGIVICAGRAPYTWEGNVRGGKDMPIHWHQEQFDQAGIVRPFVKWHAEMTTPDTALGLAQRAFAVARAAPAGPVYLTLPREVLMQPAQGQVPEPLVPPMPPAADPDAIARAAELLADAAYPLIVAGRGGRDRASVELLGKLAELIGARVIDSGQYVNLPGSHPLNAGPALAGELPRADVILLLDTDVPYVPKVARPNSGATVIQIDADPMHHGYVVWNFAADLRITAGPTTALRQLLAGVEKAMTPERRRNAAGRGEEAERRQQQDLASARDRLEEKLAKPTFDGEVAAWVLGQKLEQDAIVLDESLSNGPWVRAHVKRNQPGTRYTSGGASLGWALGAAVGVKLAQPERTVVALTGDGGFNFGSPVAALWSAHNAGAAFLTVIFNNAAYAVTKHPLKAFYPDSACQRTGDYVFTDIAPPPAYATIAEGCGAMGATVSSAAQMEAALDEALLTVRSGRCAVLDVVLPPV